MVRQARRGACRGHVRDALLEDVTLKILAAIMSLWSLQCLLGLEAFIESVAACRIIRVLDWPGIARVPWPSFSVYAHSLTACVEAC